MFLYLLKDKILIKGAQNSLTETTSKQKSQNQTFFNH